MSIVEVRKLLRNKIYRNIALPPEVAAKWTDVDFCEMRYDEPTNSLVVTPLQMTKKEA
jgi:hypothetical protein